MFRQAWALERFTINLSPRLILSQLDHSCFDLSVLFNQLRFGMWLDPDLRHHLLDDNTLIISPWSHLDDGGFRSRLAHNSLLAG